MEIRCHGDVFLIKESIPETAKEEAGRKILAYGEHTGHAHRLYDEDGGEEKLGEEKTKNYTVLKDPSSNVVYLRVHRATPLKHEEHKEIVLPPGEYRVGQVREKGFIDDMINPVVD